VGPGCRERGKGNGTGSVNSQGGPWAGSSAGSNRFREAQFYIFISFLLFPFLLSCFFHRICIFDSKDLKPNANVF
jgi:hypothetical protein